MHKESYSIHVGVPSQEVWQAEFGMSLAFMLTWSMKNRLVARSESERVEVMNVKGSILPYLREQLVKSAKERGATHLLFVDSDQTFPKDLIRRLLGWELPVVACNVATKQIPVQPTARLQGDTVGGEILYSNGQNGIEQVWRVGTGVMMLDMKVFDIIESPYFSMYWDEGVQQYRGEDWVLCEKLEEAGIPIFVDHSTSLKIGHCGLQIFTHDHIVTKQEYETVRNALESAA